tara:strand:- start:51 stop:245 length:195 start_codon:yes stop_codon:yes gene_type:complete
MPELVEKKEPPMITSIKKIKDKFVDFKSNESPILDILLVKDKNNKLKLLSKLKKTKKRDNKNRR